MSVPNAHRLLILTLCLAFVPWSSVLAEPAGYALWFDGADDEVDIPDAPSLNFLCPPEAMTIEFWFKNEGSRTRYHLLGKRSGCTLLNYNFGVETGAVLAFATDLNPGYQITWVPLVAPDTVWTHVAVTADGTEIRAYLNGALAVVDTGIITTELPVPLKFGQNGTCPDDFRLRGWMDEIRIWNVVRNAADIRNYYNRPVSPATPGLVGYWAFDEDSTDQHAYDLSPMHNDGTLGAGLSVGSDDPVRVHSTAPITCIAIPCAFESADVNCDGVVDVYDVLEAIQVAFVGKPAHPPCCGFQ